MTESGEIFEEFRRTGSNAGERIIRGISTGAIDETCDRISGCEMRNREIIYISGERYGI